MACGAKWGEPKSLVMSHSALVYDGGCRGEAGRTTALARPNDLQRATEEEEKGIRTQFRGGVEGIKVSHRFLKQELGFGSILNTFSAFFQSGNGKELHKTRLGQNAIGISSSSSKSL